MKGYLKTREDYESIFKKRGNKILQPMDKHKLKPNPYFNSIKYT